jgi:hypothetical protein
MPSGDSHVRETEALLMESSEPVGLCYNVADFTGFHPTQVKTHGELFLRCASRVKGVAVVRPRAVVRFGAISVALMSRVRVEMFEDLPEAMEWLETLE